MSSIDRLELSNKSVHFEGPSLFIGYIRMSQDTKIHYLSLQKKPSSKSRVTLYKKTRVKRLLSLWRTLVSGKLFSRTEFTFPHIHGRYHHHCKTKCYRGDELLCHTCDHCKLDVGNDDALQTSPKRPSCDELLFYTMLRFLYL